MRLKLKSELNFVEGYIKGIRFLTGNEIYFIDEFYQEIKDCVISIEFMRTNYSRDLGFSYSVEERKLVPHSFDELHYDSLGGTEKIELNGWLDADHVYMNGNYNLYLESDDTDLITMIKLKL